MAIDIDRARKETPGCNGVLHFNNAGASLMPAPVIDAVNTHFQNEIQMGGYEAADAAEKQMAQFYDSAAKLIHAKPQEIAFFESSTRAWDTAFSALSLKKGDRILTGKAEYVSNYIALMQKAKNVGIKIEVIPDDEYGQISLEELRKRIDSDVKLIALTHIPTQGGLINPAEEVGKIAEDHGIFYLLDATQSVGQLPIDVHKLRCDALCATGRKYLRGPRGTGFLYVKESRIESLEPPFLDLQGASWTGINEYVMRQDAMRFETWERNCCNLLGLKAAIEYAQFWGLENIWGRIQTLSTILRNKLKDIPGVSIQDQGKRQCGIVTFTVKARESSEISRKLKEKKINTSVSYVEYARLDLESRGEHSFVRASVHYYNTEEEVDRFCKALEEIASHPL